jgi:CheY-like chemotaxis protein
MEMLRQKPPAIFVIQNDDLWRYWVISTLRQAGAQVESFSTAGAAFQHLEANAAPDLMLVDVQVPDLATARFTAVLADLRAAGCQDIPVLAVSSSADPMAPERVHNLTEATGFLKLPCPEALLLNLADMLLHGSRPSGQPLVLVADDSAELRKVLASNLTYRGYKVVEAGDGAETIRLARELNPDAIILDHILPDVLGLSVMPQLQACGHPFIMVITGDPTPSLAEEYSRLGVDAFIRKPFNVGHVLDVIGTSFRLHALPAMDAPGVEPSSGPDLREERYEDLFQKLLWGVAVFEVLDDGLDFAFVAVNPAAEVLLGFRPDPPAERRLSQVLPGSLDSGLPDAMRQAWESGAMEYLSFAGCPDARCAGLGACHVLPLVTGEVAVVFAKPPGAKA